MWTFEQPLALLLLLLLIPLIFFSHFWKGRGSRLSFPLGLWQGPQFQPAQTGIKFVRTLAHFFFWVGLALVLICLAGPGLTTQQKIYLAPGTDIMIVLDESPTMAAKDFPPDSRFSAAKTVIENFVKGRENDALGLVTFGKDAALRVPPTLDYDFFLRTLRDLKIMSLGDGTSLGLGISYAALHLQNSQASQKVIIVLTDGANNSGEIQPETASDIARALGISLYVIGIGSTGTAPIEFTDPTTGKSYSANLAGGFNEELLRKLTGGQDGYYFSANSPGSLEAIFLSIDSRESTAKHVQIQVVNQPLFTPVLLVAFFCFVFYFLLRKLALGEIL